MTGLRQTKAFLVYENADAQYEFDTVEEVLKFVNQNRERSFVVYPKDGEPWSSEQAAEMVANWKR